jgi:chromosomal replication initiation ATPase DnaA
MIYDVDGNGKLSEKSLFKFVQLASLKPLSLPKNPTQILTAFESPPDIFVDIFSNDFQKVIKALAAKRTRMQSKLNHRSTKRNREISSNQSSTSQDSRKNEKAAKKKADEKVYLTLEDFVENEDGERPELLCHVI